MLQPLKHILKHLAKTVLNQILNIKGINALNPKKPLVLGSDNLTVIYGRNGSGKSGYTRVLKSACGARVRESLLCNVFEEKQMQSCEFDIQIDGKSKLIPWNPNDEIVDEMKTIDIFDSSCGISYVVDEKEVTYEPPLLKFLTYLSQVMIRVSTKLDEQSKIIDKILPILPGEYQNNVLAKKYNLVKSQNEFRNLKVKWTEVSKKKLVDIQSRLSNSQTSSISYVYSSHETYLTRLVLHLDLVSKGLDKSVFTKITALKNAITKKRQQISDSQKILEGVDIDGIDKQTWRTMWEAARDFSVEVVYPEEKFPVTKGRAKCVLCKQDLDKPSKQRLNILEKFINNRLNQELKQIEVKKARLIEELPDLWSERELTDAIASCQLTPDKIAMVKRDYVQLLQRKKDFLIAESDDDLAKLITKPTIAELRKDLSLLRKKVRQLKVSQSNNGVQALKSRIELLQN